MGVCGAARPPGRKGKAMDSQAAAVKVVKLGDAVVVIYNGHAMDAVVVAGPRVAVLKYGQKVPVYKVRIKTQDGRTKVREYGAGGLYLGVARTDVVSPRSRARERKAAWLAADQAQVADQVADA